MIKYLIMTLIVLSFPVFAEDDVKSDYQFYLHKRMSRIQKDTNWTQDSYKIGQVNAYFLCKLFMHWEEDTEDYKNKIKEIISEVLKVEGWIDNPFYWGRLNACFEILDVLNN